MLNFLKLVQPTVEEQGCDVMDEYIFAFALPCLRFCRELREESHPSQTSSGLLFSRDCLCSKATTVTVLLSLKRAEEVQANLQAKAKANYPNFIKNLLRSHVLIGFWLYPPQHDATVVLEDEDGITHETNYLAGKVAHHLKEGDVAVFQYGDLSMQLGSCYSKEGISRSWIRDACGIHCRRGMS
ncbi:hypothetical protein Dimus_007995 [Dionaea muscipula]